MLKVGLTGNMGSGKSTVASIFHCFGVPVFHADDAAKAMYLRKEVLRQVVALAGKEILGPGGHLDRRVLAGLAFADPEMLTALNRLIHPLVREDFANWLKSHTQFPYVIHEAAILFESGFANEFDRVIHVSCPEDEAIRRIEKRDMLSRNEIRQRMRFQLSDEVKRTRSDFIILNDGLTMVIPQVLQLHQTLQG
ncbi:MAG: dephospho-CoA kinase [Bacteroidetes bacterium]|nr:MAG: dephospho-CoA kinase [Bacteroidota bacterium]